MDGSGQNGPGGVHDSTGNGGMSRAERFEDEKRRIVDSCFGKKDEDDSCKTHALNRDPASNIMTSNGILHHTYQNYRRRSIPIYSTTAEFKSKYKKAASHNCCCEEVGQGSNAQSERKCQRDFFDWEDLDA